MSPAEAGTTRESNASSSSSSSFYGKSLITPSPHGDYPPEDEKAKQLATLTSSSSSSVFGKSQVESQSSSSLSIYSKPPLVREGSAYAQVTSYAATKTAAEPEATRSLAAYHKSERTENCTRDSLGETTCRPYHSQPCNRG